MTAPHGAHCSRSASSAMSPRGIPSQAHVGHALVPYQLVYDTLILREPDGELSPMLATEWSYNDDRTVLTWICATTSPSPMASRSTPRR